MYGNQIVIFHWFEYSKQKMSRQNVQDIQNIQYYLILETFVFKLLECVVLRCFPNDIVD